MLSNLLSKLTNLENLELNIQKNELKYAKAKELSLSFQAIKKLRYLKLNMEKLHFIEKRSKMSK